jgi:AcrR family transcriptional regulator
MYPPKRHLIARRGHACNEGFAPLRRGDRQRQAILASTRELLSERRFEDLSVSAIASHAGITRSGFYFYFDSKHAVLATMMEGCLMELDELTHHFSARAPKETPEKFVKRMVGSVASVIVNNDSVMSICHAVRNTDEHIRAVMDNLTDPVIAAVQKLVVDEVAAGTAKPINDDLPALVRILWATTHFVLVGDSTFVRSIDDLPRATRAVEELWLQAFWDRRTPATFVRTH